MRVCEMGFDGSVGDFMIDHNGDIGKVIGISEDYVLTHYGTRKNLTPKRCYKEWHTMISDFDSAWVIDNRTDDCWRIDTDPTKPIYLKEGFPEYDPERMLDYRLSNRPSEKYMARYQAEQPKQMTIFDFMEE